ncbi:MAG: outer-membrane lipoprotein carrier protein LolA [Pseudolabrys sp.]|nr:outer-membrane lipoprotein carrier protein LolA [Pseudolabrys sp.]
MAKHGRTLVIGAALSVLSLALAIPAMAQTAQPPKKPGPAATGTVAPPKPLAPPNGAAQPAPTNPFASLLGKPGARGNLDDKQRALVEKVSNYLATTRVLSGNFVQVGPDGRKTQGQFYLSKPGKIRFEYDAPSPIEIVADGQSVIVRDRNLATQDLYPLSQTPLRFLLADQLDLMRDTNIVGVFSDDVFVTVVLEEKNGIVGTSRLMIMFSASDLQLKQWTVTDPQGYDTTVAVYNLDPKSRPDPALFKIDYMRYRN